METVDLNTREKQNAFMNPARQDILRLLQLAGRPMTPKELSDKMGISASSVTFHIKKLVDLGVVALDHTENIRGITARYYKALNVAVRLGLLAPGGDDAAQEMFLQRTVEQVLAGTQQLSAASLLLVAGAHQLYTETSNMQLDEELGSLLDTLSAAGAPASFTSEKNAVSALQFALQTEPIQLPPAPAAEETPAQPLSFWEKLLNLFDF